MIATALTRPWPSRVRGRRWWPRLVRRRARAVDDAEGTGRRPADASDLHPLSPTADFVFTDPGVMSSHDAFGHPKALVATHRAYAAGQDSSNPDITPVDQDLSGLPRLDVHCGANELLSTEVDRLEVAAHRYGVPISVHRWPGWYIMADRLPEGRQVLDEAAAAIRKAITTVA